MIDVILNQIAMIVYLGAAISLLWEMTNSKERANSIGVWLGWAGFGLQTAGLIWRWIASYRAGIGHAPLTNRYESLIFFSWSIVLVFLILRNYLGLKKLGAFMMLAGSGFIGVTSLIPGSDAQITPLVPALQSNWLLFHVATCFFGYAAFAAAFIGGIYCLTGTSDSKSSEKQDVTDQIIYRSVIVGFLLLTLGIVSGSAWAYNAWGRYWGWDPKEVWSLITWFVYAIFLHARITKGWSGRKLAILAIIGFLFVLFTFLGVNYLSIFKGLHSYA